MAFKRISGKKYAHICSLLFPRQLSTNLGVVPELDKTLRDDVENNKMKPRKHPGVRKLPPFTLPDKIVNAIRVVIEERKDKTAVFDDAKMLSNYLYSRHYPWEEEDLKTKREGFTERVISKIGELPADSSQEQVENYKKEVANRVKSLESKHCYTWRALDLHDYSCLVYLIARAAPNYAAVKKVFHEITKVCPDYKPTSLFDFGSGLGTASWAATELWADSLKEFINVDSSGSMNTLAGQLLTDGNPEAAHPAGVYYRQFLPAQHTKHSIVVSAHSLMELPSQESRLDTLINLWNKTQDFLILVEQGTKPGFKVIVEARDFILSLPSPAHVFAPCPHDTVCPRMLRGPYPCHYQVSYFSLPVGQKTDIKKELFSYIIIKKGKREEGNNWPRVVRPVLLRHNHAICRLCTAHGDLREIVFTKNRHGKVLYKFAKVTNWGDYMPIDVPAISPEDAEQQCHDETSDDECEADLSESLPNK